jgi:hypothetical protein
MPGLPRIIKVVFCTVVVVGIFGSCDFSCYCWTDVRNNTPYHLHMLGQYESHLYVPPGGLKSMKFEEFNDPPLSVLIAPGQSESAQIIIPVDCGYRGCHFIDIQWEDSPPALVFERLDCTYEPDASLDGGG